MGLIYYALNKSQGQIMMYIGKVETETGSGRTFQDRKDEHIEKAAERDTDFHNMLFRKGIDNWEWGFLDRNYPDALLKEREKYWIKKYKEQKSIILTNEVHNKREKKKNTTQNNFAKRSASQNSLENIETMQWHYRSGQIKPLKNTTTKKHYRSINKAAKDSGISATSIRYSCTTGRPAVNNQKYVFVDLSGKEITPEDYNPNLSERKNNRSYSKIKHINTGQTYETIKGASKKLNLKENSIQAVCNGTYKSTSSTKQKRGSHKISHSFCYVDFSGKDVLTDKHNIFITDLEEKGRYKIAVYEIDDSDYKSPLLYEDIEEIMNDPKLGLTASSKNHIPSVIKGERTHTGGFRFAKYDTKEEKAELHEKHKEDAKKIIQKVICLNDKKIYKNASKAAKHYQLNSNQIRLCCKGVLKTTGNDESYKRYRFAYLDKNDTPIITEKHKTYNKIPTRKGTPVFCAELGGLFPSKEEFLRQVKAKKNIKIPKKTLDKHLNNPKKYPLDEIFVHYHD